MKLSHSCQGTERWGVLRGWGWPWPCMAVQLLQGSRLAAVCTRCVKSSSKVSHSWALRKATSSHIAHRGPCFALVLSRQASPARSADTERRHGKHNFHLISIAGQSISQPLLLLVGFPFPIMLFPHFQAEGKRLVPQAESGLGPPCPPPRSCVGSRRSGRDVSQQAASAPREPTWLQTAGATHVVCVGRPAWGRDPVMTHSLGSEWGLHTGVAAPGLEGVGKYCTIALLINLPV